MSTRLLLAACVAVLGFSQEPPAFRSEVSLVHVDAEVTDGIRTLTGFRKEDFLVRDNGQPQTVLYFSHDEEPLDVILLFDISGSMRPKIEMVATGAHTALAELRAGDRIAVMVFDHRSRMVAPFTDDLGAVERTIKERVLGEKFRGGTRILAAVDHAAEYFLEQPRTQRRRAVLILTDDFGQQSRRSGTVVRRLWEGGRPPEWFDHPATGRGDPNDRDENYKSADGGALQRGHGRRRRQDRRRHAEGRRPRRFVPGSDAADSQTIQPVLRHAARKTGRAEKCASGPYARGARSKSERAGAGS
jgi:VWFA-related protein